MLNYATSDVRLVYIGSRHKAEAYAAGHLPAPAPRPDQILVARGEGDLAGWTLPHWCHIGVELVTDRSGTRPAVSEAWGLFAAALARRNPPPRKVGA